MIFFLEACNERERERDNDCMCMNVNVWGSEYQNFELFFFLNDKKNKTNIQEITMTIFFIQIFLG